MPKFQKKPLLVLVLSVLLILGVGILLFKSGKDPKALQDESVAVQTVGSKLAADGMIRSQNEANLNFQMGGKLVYLPFKEGDAVSRGQTIAQLDTYALQRQLTASLNNYRTTRDNFDQAQDNSVDLMLQGQQKYLIETQNHSGIGGDAEYRIVQDIIKRILDQSQATLDNSVINVELANYSLQLSTLSSPIDGIITHEDVSVPFVNVTPGTMFSVADPKSLVFRANVAASDLDFVDLGAQATIKIDGLADQSFSGTVIKIYPQKMKSTSGQDVYQVDIQSDALKSMAKYNQAGKALITSNTRSSTILIPTWTVLGYDQVWVDEDGKAVLKKVKVGKIHGDQVEILDGLSASDKIIISPQSIVSQIYRII